MVGCRAPFVISNYLIDVAIEFRQLIDIRPYFFIVSMKNMGTIVMDINPVSFYVYTYCHQYEHVSQ